MRNSAGCFMVARRDREALAESARAASVSRADWCQRHQPSAPAATPARENNNCDRPGCTQRRDFALSNTAGWQRVSRVRQLETSRDGEPKSSRGPGTANRRPDASARKPCDSCGDNNRLADSRRHLGYFPPSSTPRRPSSDTGASCSLPTQSRLSRTKPTCGPAGNSTGVLYGRAS